MRLLWLLLLGAVRAPEPACDFAVVDDPALLRRHQQPTLLRGGAEHWPALREWRGFPAFVTRHPDLSLPIRRPETTARGQSFRRAERHVTLRQWGRTLRQGGAPPLVFDSNGSSALLATLGADIRPLGALAAVLQTPLFSLADGTAAEDSKTGLAFHHHDESWLALLSGVKIWFVPSGTAEPESAYDRRPLAQLLQAREAGALRRCEQRPGDVVYLPAHTWHATYSSGGAVLGVGGMGDSTEAIGLAVTGDLAGLSALAAAEPGALSRRNAKGELPTHRAATVEVLAWLATEGGVPFLDDADHDGGGGQPIHAAALRGDMASMAWLHEHGARLDAVSARSGQQPAHFAAAGRSLAALAWLHAHGASVEARSGSGQVPLHLAALAGDREMLAWLLEQGADVAAVRTSDGATAAHFAAVGGDGDPATALRTLMFLDKRGADLSARTLQGQTALDLWMASPEEMESLALADEEFAEWWRDKLRHGDL